MTNLLHIFPQLMWHTEATIIGDREALTKLRDAIDATLTSANTNDQAETAFTTFAADGEGYRVLVLCREGDVWDKIAFPYTDEVAAENREGDEVIWGWKLCADYKKLMIGE